MKMKLSAAFAAAALTAMPALGAPAYNPVADPGAVVTAGCARFTVLTPEMIRVEYSPAGRFDDQATFAVVNRRLPVPQFTQRQADGFLYITTPRLTLKYRLGTNPLTKPASPDNLSVTFGLNGEQVQWHPGKADPQNLKGTYRTLDGNEADAFRSRLEEGLISRSGWAVIDDSPKATRCDGSSSLALVPQPDGGTDWVAQRADPDALDLYLLAYGHDYKRALADFTSIAGTVPLPPDYVFGYWYSRYWAYTADEFRNISRSLAENGINTDVMIIDMDWHFNGNPEISGGRGGWTGWTWNPRLIPDPEGLLADLHRNGHHVALNLHPADGFAPDEDFFPEISADLGRNPADSVRVPWMLENPTFAKSFFRHFARTREAQGVDFWWIDWQQQLVNDNEPGLGNTFWCNHTFFNDMKLNRPDHRPVIYHRWGGLGSHRYQIGFSGDTYATFPTLAFEPYFTATASNVCYAYWGHDLGGHQGGTDPNNPEMLLRWIQYGVFTPIFKTHATADPKMERRIWLYPNLPTMREAVDLRYALFPYIYTMARKCHDTGVGICRPLYYENPERDEAYTNDDHYYFGDDIFVAPIVTPGDADGIATRSIWMPEGNSWWSPSLSRSFAGNQTVELAFAPDQIPYFVRHGAVIVKNPASVKRVTERPSELVLDVVAGADGSATLYEDAGDNQDYDTAYATTLITHRESDNTISLEIAPRQGSYDGMPLERSYQVNIANVDACGTATVNGCPTPSTYNAATRTATIQLPAAPCTTSTLLEIVL